MRRRKQMILTVSTPVLAARPTDVAAFGAPRTKASRSSWPIRPAGPVPRTWRRSTPASRARRRTAGDASGFSPGGRGGPTGARLAGASGAVGTLGAEDRGTAAITGAVGRSAGGGASRGAATTSSLPSPATSRRTSSAPTATTPPTSAPSATTVPATGDGISTVALSVMTAARSWSSNTDWPTSTCHSTSSASATPSPTSGSLMMRIPISGLHHGLECPADPGRPREIVPFLGVRIGRVPAGDAHHGCLEMVEAILLHQRTELGAEPRGQRRLMDDDASSRLLDGGGNRLEVVRNERAQIDDLRVDAGLPGSGFGNEDHGAVGEHRHCRALAANGGLAEGNRVVAVRNLALGMARPRRHRPIVMAVERAVVEPLGLEKNHRIVVLDRGNQQALGVVRVRRHDGFQARDMGEQRLRALAVRLAAEDPAAGRHAHDQRCGELAIGPITQSCRLRHDLVVGRIHVVGELDFDARPQPVGRHADRGADDAQLADRRIEASTGAELLLQSLGAAEHAAEIADILAEHDDALVALHGDLEGVADRLDHGPARHG